MASVPDSGLCQVMVATPCERLESYYPVLLIDASPAATAGIRRDSVVVAVGRTRAYWAAAGGTVGLTAGLVGLGWSVSALTGLILGVSGALVARSDLRE